MAFLTGLTTWVNALECLSLSAIFLILLFLVRSERKEMKEGAVTFDMSWAALGVAVGICSWWEFIAEVLRTKSWTLFMRISHVLAIINLWILLPVWLIVLGLKLAKMRQFHYNQEKEILENNEHSNPALSITHDE